MSTPAEELGYKVGDRFRINEGAGANADNGCKCSVFTDGAIVELDKDDGTRLPYFTVVEGFTRFGDGAYEDLAFLEKIV